MLALSKKNTDKGVRVKQAFALSDSITALWNCFLSLASKVAEPVLVALSCAAPSSCSPLSPFPHRLTCIDIAHSILSATKELAEFLSISLEEGGIDA